MTLRRGRYSRAPHAALGAALVGFLALMTGYGAGASSAIAPRQTPDVGTGATRHIERQVEALMNNPALQRASIGILVRSLDRGDTLAAVNENMLLMPASTAKVITLAVAADRLGWDYTFRTIVQTLGRVEAGVLHGDLLVVGTGDPTLDDWTGTASQRFEALAETLKAAGITAISGRIIGDDNALADEALGNGWAWDDLASSFATSVGALQFNQNTAQLEVRPAARAGAPALVEVVPATAPVLLRNLATTGAGGASVLATRPLRRSGEIELTGTVSGSAVRLVRNVAVANPTIYFVNALRAGLIRNGIEVRGPSVDIDDVADTLDRSDARSIAEIGATTLRDIAEPMMKNSQNLYAETLFETLGAGVSGDGSPEAARVAIDEALTGWGVPEGAFRLVDGSGLSRYNLVTPGVLMTVLTHVHRDDRLRDEYLATLPIAGVDGTLSGRMVRTPAAGRVRAKTGSFSNARAVAGYVRARNDEQLAFVIVVNNFNADNALVDDLSDRIIVALAGLSRETGL
jgi:D-alanyl-D-alanine carboxypeptidase/D-alanyl-D-alanine-endopeptidase (penicillin-binding protein 4)